jgi:acyl transferase domain-containing protein
MPRETDSAICVIGAGAILPDADSPAAFWENVLAGHTSLRPLPAGRWNQSLYVSSGAMAEDKSITAFGAAVSDDVLDREAAAAGIARGEHNRLEILALGAARQALRDVNLHPVSPDRVAIYLGCMNVDEALAYQRFMIDDGGDLAAHVAAYFPDRASEIVAAIEEHFDRWKTSSDLLRRNLFPTSILALLRESFAIAGESLLIDAACASSLAAIDTGMRALRSGAADLVVTGGIESNLAPYTFALFSRLGVLARERCLPLDGRSDGMSQGEGAVIFVLQRQEDARAAGHRIRGVLAGCGAASDGGTTSLFAPYAEGQLRAYETAYRDVDRNDVVYIECHATGTRIGDETELRSLDRFFGRSLPVGSVKSLVGHTKGAAGAVSLLKCLLSLQHRVIPPSPYFQEPIVDGGVYVNLEAIPIPPSPRPIAFGISSFGFGGINYHLVLQEPHEWPPEVSVGGTATKDVDGVVVIGRHWRSTTGVRGDAALSRLATPPRNRLQIDEVQLAALLAVDELSRRLGVSFRRMDRRRVTVISAGCLCLAAACVLAGRVTYFELAAALERFGPDVVAVSIAHKVKHPPISGASGPGILNNVIAGRVANVFDLQGPTFHVDADLASHAAAMSIAHRRLMAEDGLVIILSADETYVAERARINRHGVACTFVASTAFALKYNLPICDELVSVECVPA